MGTMHRTGDSHAIKRSSIASLLSLRRLDLARLALSGGCRALLYSLSGPHRMT